MSSKSLLCVQEETMRLKRIAAASEKPESSSYSSTTVAAVTLSVLSAGYGFVTLTIRYLQCNWHDFYLYALHCRSFDIWSYPISTSTILHRYLYVRSVQVGPSTEGLSTLYIYAALAILIIGIIFGKFFL